MKTFLILVTACATLIPGFSRAARVSHPKDKTQPYRDFEQVCLSIFAQHAADSENASGNRICKCTSKESKQGVTVSELKAETAKIRKNPKYEIKNPKLLASFQYCVVLAMDEKAHEEDSSPSDSK